MTRTDRSPSGRRRRSTLTREEIVDAAVALAQDEGLAALTMGAVAARVGVAAMSLYTHVASKADLLLAVYRRLAEQTAVPVRAQGQPWDDWLVAVMADERRTLLAHPELGREVLLLYATNAARGPVGIAPGGRILDVFVGEGMTEEDATRAYITLSTFHTGFVLWEIDRFHTQDAAAYRRDFLQRLAEADEPPTRVAWAALGVVGRPVDELYEEALRTVVAGVAARYLPGSVGGPSTGDAG